MQPAKMKTVYDVGGICMDMHGLGLSVELMDSSVLTLMDPKLQIGFEPCVLVLAGMVPGRLYTDHREEVKELIYGFVGPNISHLFIRLSTVEKGGMVKPNYEA